MKLLKKQTALLYSLAWDELKVRYSRSILGPFWIVLTTGISALGLSYIWSIIFHQDRETFIPNLCIGLVIWQFASSCIIEAPGCFHRYRAIIINIPIAYIVFPITIVVKNFIILLHNSIIIAIVWLIYPPTFDLNFLLLIPGILLVMINLTIAVTILSFFGARYKDVEVAIFSLIPIIFFLTPVIFKLEHLGIKTYLMWLNPFTYLINAIREPLLNQSPPLFVYITMITTAIIGTAFSYFLIHKYRNRLPYWI